MQCRRSVQLFCSAQSLQICSTCAGRRRVCRVSAVSAGSIRATSRMSSTIFSSRLALWPTIWVSRWWWGSVKSSSSSALACAIAANGLRISCATAVDMRPMLASFSVRMRASSSRWSCKNTTHKLAAPIPCGAASRVRARMRRSPWLAWRIVTSASWARPVPMLIRVMLSSGSQAASSFRLKWRSVCSDDTPSNCRAEGLAPRTMPCSSTISTPSGKDSITNSFTCC